MDEHRVYTITYHKRIAILFSLYDSVKCKSYEPKGDSYPGLSLRMLHELFDRLSFATAFTPELLCETRCSPLLRVQYALFEEVQYENRRT